MGGMTNKVAIAVLVVGVALIIAGSTMLGIGIHKLQESHKTQTTPSCSKTTQATPSQSTTSKSYDRSEISKYIQNEIKPTNIVQNIVDFTHKLHLAGTEQNLAVANMIADKYRKAGLQDVHLVSYDVLLSYPNFSNPNLVTIKDNTGSVLFQTSGISPPIIKNQQFAGDGIQWLAYAPPGTITAPVVYCGKGTPQDFDILAQKGVSVKGAIALIRYGGIFRGDKVKNAEKNGAKGVILYSDPEEYAQRGVQPEDVYPNTLYMPPDGVQRGTLYTGSGDPLSPLYPSKKNQWRSRTIDEATQLGYIPTIPAVPISYTTAKRILEGMQGVVAPSSFNGTLDVVYRLGPGYTGQTQLTMTVHESKQTKTIHNVIGYIYGSEEPDRYVILGNHYDAWTYGAMDPNAGTGILAEVARASMAVSNSTGWRPARTLMFAAWDAEEYGTIGSTEFVEEFTSILDRRAIAYINFDCFKGNTSLYVQGSPSLTSSIYRAAKNVPNPNPAEVKANRPTTYDTWLKTYPDSYHKTIPYLDIPRGGSDMEQFFNYLGVAFLNFYYVDPNEHFTYPLYHTLYETIFSSQNITDTNNFATHVALGRFWAENAIGLADMPVIPITTNDLTYQITQYYIPQLITAIQTTNKILYTADGVQQLVLALETAANLTVAGYDFDIANGQLTHSDDVLKRIRINDRLINFERCFVNPRGMPGNPVSRHVLFSISSGDIYAGSVMQQIYSILTKMSQTEDVSTLKQLSRQFAQQIAIVNYSLQCALNVIQNIH